MRLLLCLALIYGCGTIEPSEPCALYWTDNPAFYTHTKPDSTETAVSAEFINTSRDEYSAFPRLYAGDRPFDGGLGYLARPDRSETATDEDRFQPLQYTRATIKPGEKLMVKVLTGWYYDPNRESFRLVFVINGKER